MPQQWTLSQRILASCRLDPKPESTVSLLSIFNSSPVSICGKYHMNPAGGYYSVNGCFKLEQICLLWLLECMWGGNKGEGDIPHATSCKKCVPILLGFIPFLITIAKEIQITKEHIQKSLIQFAFNPANDFPSLSLFLSLPHSTFSFKLQDFYLQKWLLYFYSDTTIV